MPGLSSTRYESWEMEYDRYQHYFYDDHDSEEDFYKSTAPSEDIWKKFELVPTPPMSPIRTLDGATMCPSPGDKLEWVSQFLGQDEEQEAQYKFDTKEIFGNLSSIINQDCMWSGFSASQRLDKVVSERLSGSGQTKTHLGVQTGITTVSRSQCATQDLQVVGNLTTDCVDPAAVFTYPFASGCKKQASSGSESRTDSSDDEEIDVVTVENKQNKSRLMSGRKPVTITVRADPHDPCMKRFHISIHQQQHNYAAPSPDSDPEDEPPGKKAKREPCCHHPGPAPSHAEKKPPASAPTPAPAPPSQTDSPHSSDSEDTDKRKTHNFLERKRRNDLRSRFLALRDQIPGLANSTKTPKVVILTQAAEYLEQLHTSDRHKAQERRQLKARQQQLLKRLAELRHSEK
ncbi:protein L-Myc-1b-like [Megalops cyprinoides]|uniref:protein L-Myc-1b-like n=1 Tax=Megalops cyprinoides TaxID=118141 RepID=UPI001864AB59|nr:protein L-Myc-1b-like [Megalops cyprinoides]